MDALLLLLFVMLGLMLGLQVVVRKIFRKIISGKSSSYTMIVLLVFFVW
jgi:hypothetical protein